MVTGGKTVTEVHMMNRKQTIYLSRTTRFITDAFAIPKKGALFEHVLGLCCQKCIQPVPLKINQFKITLFNLIKSKFLDMK